MDTPPDHRAASPAAGWAGPSPAVLPRWRIRRRNWIPAPAGMRNAVAHGM